jgi:hypothetical protein
MVEAAVVLPVLLAATFALVVAIQLAAWKLTGDAAAGAGAEVLAAGGSAIQAVEMARNALKAPASFAPTVTATVSGTTGTVQLTFTVPAPLGPVQLGALRTVVVPGVPTPSGGTTGLGSGLGNPGGSGGFGSVGGGTGTVQCDHVILSPSGRLVCHASPRPRGPSG